MKRSFEQDICQDRPIRSPQEQALSDRLVSFAQLIDHLIETQNETGTRGDVDPLRMLNSTSDENLVVMSLNDSGERVHEDGSSLDLPAPARSGAPLAPLDQQFELANADSKSGPFENQTTLKLSAVRSLPSDDRVLASERGVPEGLEVAVRKGEDGATVARSRPKLDPLVEELDRCHRALEVMDEFPSFEDALQEESFRCPPARLGAAPEPSIIIKTQKR